MSGVTLENLKRGIDAALGRRKSCLALTNAKVVDVMNCEVIPGATVVIDGGRIAAVLRGEEAESVNAQSVVDCGGKSSPRCSLRGSSPLPFFPAAPRAW